MMKRILFSILFANFTVFAGAYAATSSSDFSCGPGYILVSHSDIDGIDAMECQKLWCRDLETGKTMGSGDRANTGYKTTAYSMELCDANGNCIECFGDRKWCSGQPEGYWNPEYGAYTYGGADNATYSSYQRGSCFAWNLGKPDCPDGQTAVVQNGEWVCAVSTGTTTGGRGSSVRRTSGSLRRVIP